MNLLIKLNDADKDLDICVLHTSLIVDVRNFELIESVKWQIWSNFKGDSLYLMAHILLPFYELPDFHSLWNSYRANVLMADQHQTFIYLLCFLLPTKHFPVYIIQTRHKVWIFMSPGNFTKHLTNHSEYLRSSCLYKLISQNNLYLYAYSACLLKKYMHIFALTWIESSYIIEK